MTINSGTILSFSFVDYSIYFIVIAKYSIIPLKPCLNESSRRRSRQAHAFESIANGDPTHHHTRKIQRNQEKLATTKNVFIVSWWFWMNRWSLSVTVSINVYTVYSNAIILNHNPRIIGRHHKVWAAIPEWIRNKALDTRNGVYTGVVIVTRKELLLPHRGSFVSVKKISEKSC